MSYNTFMCNFMYINHNRIKHKCIIVYHRAICNNQCRIIPIILCDIISNPAGDSGSSISYSILRNSIFYLFLCI